MLGIIREADCRQFYGWSLCLPIRFWGSGGESVPDAKTMVRLGQALGPELIRNIHQRVVQLARKEKVVTGRKMGLDTTAVETNIHYPTDSSLLGDGARVLIRIMNRIEKEVGRAGTKVRERMRSVIHRLIEIGRASRCQGEEAKTKQKKAYRKLMAITRRVVVQARVVIKEVRRGIKKAADWRGQLVVDALARQLKDVNALTCRVLEQTKARVIKSSLFLHAKYRILHRKVASQKFVIATILLRGYRRQELPRCPN